MAGKRQATYSPEQRREALDLYVAHGGAEASRRTGVAAVTIRSWAVRDGKTGQRRVKSEAATAAVRRTWAERRGETVLRLGEVASNLIERADCADSERDAAHAMRAANDAIKNAELLSGSPTERVEQPEGNERLDREVGDDASGGFELPPFD